MAQRIEKDRDFIKFLGTAGARFVMLKQLRSSGGIWVKYRGTNLIIDPGPGSLVRMHSSRPKLNPADLNGIILTHKHLDHSGDVNVMIEAMTEGGFKKRGTLFAPADAFGPEGVIFTYLKDLVSQVTILEEGKFSVGNINFAVPIRNLHSVITYGVKFFFNGKVISLLSDTKYSDNLINVYKDSNVLILNVVFYERRDGYEHLCLEDAVKIAEIINPELTIFTHFGMGILRQKPYLLEKKLQERMKQKIKFATDGFIYNL